MGKLRCTVRASQTVATMGMAQQGQRAGKEVDQRVDRRSRHSSTSQQQWHSGAGVEPADCSAPTRSEKYKLDFVSLCFDGRNLSKPVLVDCAGQRGGGEGFAGAAGGSNQACEHAELLSRRALLPCIAGTWPWDAGCASQLSMLPGDTSLVRCSPVGLTLCADHCASTSACMRGACQQQNEPLPPPPAGAAKAVLSLLPQVPADAWPGAGAAARSPTVPAATFSSCSALSTAAFPTTPVFKPPSTLAAAAQPPSTFAPASQPPSDIAAAQPPAASLTTTQPSSTIAALACT